MTGAGGGGRGAGGLRPRIPATLSVLPAFQNSEIERTGILPLLSRPLSPLPEREGITWGEAGRGVQGVGGSSELGIVPRDRK